ncbi:MAG TPA: response regulator, partial [Bryobacteraceae bacterium]|nr:response regulator [Bryobacteraceae bacterium]
TSESCGEHVRAYLVDDEPLALARLHRMLEGRLEIVGEQSDPVLAAAEIDELAPDVLFLDIEMPEWSGFKLLESLKRQPLVVFTTAYNQYALQAFEVNSIDYLLKPVEPQKLDRALAKLERLSAGAGPRPDLQALLRQIAASLPSATLAYPDRLASKVGDKVEFIELARVTHIFAKEKLTFAATPKKKLRRGSDDRRIGVKARSQEVRANPSIDDREHSVRARALQLLRGPDDPAAERRREHRAVGRAGSGEGS